jgi:pyridoxal phosphate enzyme (YggS family)
MQEKSLTASITYIKKKIRDIAQAAGRNPDAITLIAVTKNRSIDTIKEATQAGLAVFGENRVQELITKAPALPQAQWHLIGHLQTNKVKQVLPYVALIQSLDSIKLAETINKYSAALDQQTRCLIQVNISYEQQKSGILPEHIWKLLKKIETLPNIKIEGLMGIATHTEDSALIRKEFQLLARLQQEIRQKYQDSSIIQMHHLSMGMSHDYPIAIEEGATMLRIGSAIFE